MIIKNFDFKIRDAESKDLSSVHQIFDAAIDGENQTSIHFHEKMGFVKVACMENIARKFSRDLTLVLMQLRLKIHG